MNGNSGVTPLGKQAALSHRDFWVINLSAEHEWRCVSDVCVL